MISFETYWLFLLTPLPLFIYRLVPAVSDQSPALRVPFLDELAQIEQGQSVLTQRSLLLNLTLWMIWLLLIIAVNRPIIIGDAIQLPTEARDMMLAVDISGSMNERDMRIDTRRVMRIDIVKHVLSDFTDRRAGDRLGLILFADNAYLQAPLTYDTQTVRQLLNEAQLGFAGEKTAIGDAIGLAIKRLVKRPAESRTLILLTDGVNNAGHVSPLEAAKLAAENDIKIHTIGIGASKIVERSFFGNRTRNPSRSLDEKTLQSIATQTGGKYFRAKNTEELESIYAELDKLEPVDQDPQFFRPQKQIFYLPLSLAFTLASLILGLKVVTQSLRRMGHHSANDSNPYDRASDANGKNESNKFFSSKPRSSKPLKGEQRL